LLGGARLIQFMIGGVDFIPLGDLPQRVPVATNGGGYAESMAEHALAMALAAAKRLLLEHENLKRGQFNQCSSICQTSSFRRTTRHKALARTTSACAAPLRTVAAR
jgi:phosphoglycerate dehydrogenase-like enzyme